MKNKLFARSKFALRACLIVFVFSLLLSANAFSRALDSNVFVKAVSVNSFDRDENEIFELINDERRRKRLADLDWDDQLASVARRYSQQMARGNFFSHYDQKGKSVEDRANAARITNWNKIGENLFYCEGLDDFNAFAVRGWMKSPTHKQNILDRDWTETGIGIAASRDGRIYITQVFLKR